LTFTQNNVIINKSMKAAHSFSELYQQLRIRKIPFLVAFFVTIFVTYFILYVVDFIPEAPETVEEAETVELAVLEDDITPSVPSFEVVTNKAALPLEVYFERFDRTVTVLNPESSDITVLDNALLSGVVRHPQSADFSTAGNMLILGHSSYLPNVFNKNFQAFNDLQKLTWGDKIYVRSDDTEYVYRVEKVYEAKASNVVVPATPGEARLTLATCDVLGAKEDRYIVEAELVDTVSL